MGDRIHDPTDHSRTTNPHAGASMIDSIYWPGLFLVAMGAILCVVCLGLAAYEAQDAILTIGVISVGAVVTGVIWLTLERRRVHRIAEQWLAEHSKPDEYQDRQAD